MCFNFITYTYMNISSRPLNSNELKLGRESFKAKLKKWKLILIIGESIFKRKIAIFGDFQVKILEVIVL